ncbi:hypothetical protein [Segatella hominis]
MLIFGIGGVGSWCAEGLLRSGVRNILSWTVTVSA